MIQLQKQSMMIKKIIISILLLFFLACERQNPEAKSIKATYKQYITAILTDKGDEAVDFVDSRTIKYYSDISEKVKTADKATINSLLFMDKFFVLLVRHHTSREEILSFDGKKLFVYAVNNGMIGRDSVTNNLLGKIKVNGDFAKGQLVVKGKKTPLYFHFYKEENRWKIDLTSIFPASNKAFKKLVKESGMTENKYIFEIIEIVSNKKVEAEVWEPIEKAGA